MRDRFPLAVVGGLVLLAIAGSYLLRGAQRGRFADPLSTWRSEKDGARGLFLLAQESGIQVGRHQSDLELLEPRAALALIGVYFEGMSAARTDLLREEAPDGGVADDEERSGDLEYRQRGMNTFTAPRVDDDELEKLLSHVAEGHTLLYVPVGDPDDPLLKELGASLTPVQGSDGVRTFVTAGPSPWTLGVRKAQARARTHLNVPPKSVPLLVDEELGGTVMALLPWKQGRVVILSAPELAMNFRLGDADNAQLWLSVLRQAAGGGTVLFDEFHHGFTDDRSIAEFAARYGLHFAVLQLLLGLGLWAVAMRRFGRPRVPDAEERIGATDALFATSRIYREGRHSGYAAQLISRGLSQELALHAGLTVRAPAADVSRALRTRNEAALADALDGLCAQAQEARSDHDVELCAAEAARVRSELYERRHA